MRSRGERFRNGYARNARNSANARWIERIWLSFITPKFSANGSGDAYQSWISDHATQVVKSTRFATPAGRRPPRSASCTRRATSTAGAAGDGFIATSACAGAEGARGRDRAPRSLHQALFLEVTRRAFVQRCGEPVLGHGLGVEVCERRVQLLELVQVVEHR